MLRWVPRAYLSIKLRWTKANRRLTLGSIRPAGNLPLQSTKRWQTTLQRSDSAALAACRPASLRCVLRILGIAAVCRLFYVSFTRHRTLMLLEPALAEIVLHCGGALNQTMRTS